VPIVPLPASISPLAGFEVQLFKLLQVLIRISLSLGVARSYSWWENVSDTVEWYCFSGSCYVNPTLHFDVMMLDNRNALRATSTLNCKEIQLLWRRGASFSLFLLLR
jgi:hypothetical protein